MENLTEMWRRQPMYTFSEAATLANLTTQTVRNWFLGRKSGGVVVVSPLFPDGASQDSMISFLQLIETVVAAQFRKLDNVHYRNVHSAYRYAREKFDVEYPFAHLNLEALGGHIIARLEGERIGDSLQALDSPAQWSLPGLIIETIRQIEYENDLAGKWFPAGKDSPIVIDPRVSSGIPTIVGTGVTVQTIRKRRQAGQESDFIAQDLSLEVADVETVLQYGDRIAA